MVGDVHECEIIWEEGVYKFDSGALVRAPPNLDVILRRRFDRWAEEHCLIPMEIELYQDEYFTNQYTLKWGPIDKNATPRKREVPEYTRDPRTGQRMYYSSARQSGKRQFQEDYEKIYEKVRAQMNTEYQVMFGDLFEEDEDVPEIIRKLFGI